MFVRFLTLILTFIHFVHGIKNCTTIESVLTQTIENDGFHRIIHWIVEIEKADIKFNECFLALYQEIPSGAYVNPDQIADLNRIGKLSARVQGTVDVEKSTHHADPHSVYLYAHLTQDRIDLQVPIHLRYQRAQISGDYGRVEIQYPSLLFRCKYKLNICGEKISAPVSMSRETSAYWTNVSYESNSERLEVMVPIGNLDDYPLVAIVTFLVTCCGCIYLLSVILSKPLPATI